MTKPVPRARSEKNSLGTISLVVAALGFGLINFVPWPVIGSLWLFQGFSLRHLIAAFFDASLIGSLADWFAVSALFRYPFGLKLPHTNVIARNKDSVAEAVPRFLTGFVSGDSIQRELSGLDFASLLERALSEGGQRAEVHEFIKSRLSRAAGGEGLQTEVRSLLASLIDLVATEVDLPGVGASLSAWARKSAFTDRILSGLAQLLLSEMNRNHEELVSYLTQKLKKGAGWQGIFIGTGTTEKIVEAVKIELDGIQRNPRHELRLFIFSALDSWTTRLRQDQAERQRFRTLVVDAITNPALVDQLQQFALDLVARMGRDLAGDDSRFVGTLERIENLFLERIGSDPDFRAAFNRSLVQLLSDLVTKSRLIESMSTYLATQMKRTDTKLFVEQVERSVWNDLQYIRVNGAVVGGLAGLVLAIVQALLS